MPKLHALIMSVIFSVIIKRFLVFFVHLHFDYKIISNNNNKNAIKLNTKANTTLDMKFFIYKIIFLKFLHFFPLYYNLHTYPTLCRTRNSENTKKETGLRVFPSKISFNFESISSAIHIRLTNHNCTQTQTFKLNKIG